MGQLVFQATLGGQVNLVGPNTASTFNINVPAVAGNMVTTGDTGTVTSTMLSTTTLTAFAATTASSNKGAFNYGTLNFSDTGIVQSLQTSVNSYFQNVIQNTSNGTAASAEFIAYNDQGTATTNFATMGINSSGYTGTGSINAAGYAYFLSGSTDLVLGTIGSNKIHFTVNSGATDAMLIDTSGNVGVGVTPSAWVSPALPAIDIGTMGAIAGQTSASNLHFVANGYLGSGPAWKYKTTNYSSRFTAGNDSGTGGFAWYTAPSGTAGNAITYTQAMTLDASGNWLLGATTYSAGNGNYLLASPTGVLWVGHINGTSSGTAYENFQYNGSSIGSITQNGTTGVLYNLTSDYRLKNNQEDLTGAKDFIMALKPKKWQWWDGSGEGVGFIAHEFMEVAKYSGHGEKDAVETIEIKDEDGNVTGTEERPIYQSIQPSSSEVMANLVAHIQNLETRLATLEAK